MSKYRLTAVRCNGIKTGYWSMARKDELVQRLGKYEDICADPDELKATVGKYEALLQRHNDLLQKYQEQYEIDRRAKQ